MDSMEFTKIILRYTMLLLTGPTSSVIRLIDIHFPIFGDFIPLDSIDHIERLYDQIERDKLLRTKEYCSSKMV